MMQCAYIFASTPDAEIRCNREGDRWESGIVYCSLHEPQHPAPTWVYLLTWGNWVKIGMSQTPIKRRRQIELGRGAVMPEYQEGPLELVGAIPGDRATERVIHAMLAEHRGPGEWFRRTPEVERLIDAVIKEGKGNLDAVIEQEPEPQFSHLDF